MSLVCLRGKCSWFGGPEDTGVSPKMKGLRSSMIEMDAPHLFLPYQPEGTSAASHAG